MGHPPMEQRIARLLELVTPGELSRRPLTLPVEGPRELLTILARGVDRPPRWHMTGLWH